MITPKDIQQYLRDLFYVEDEFLKELEQSGINAKTRQRLHDNALKKQVIIGRLINLEEEQV